MALEAWCLPTLGNQVCECGWGLRLVIQAKTIKENHRLFIGNLGERWTELLGLHEESAALHGKMMPRKVHMTEGDRFLMTLFEPKIRMCLSTTSLDIPVNRSTFFAYTIQDWISPLTSERNLASQRATVTCPQSPIILVSDHGFCGTQCLWNTAFSPSSVWPVQGWNGHRTGEESQARVRCPRGAWTRGTQDRV
jgi:hypothetical protein